MSWSFPEHSPKLGAQWPRNNFYCPGEYAWSLREYSYQLFGVLSLASVHNIKSSLKPLSMHRIHETRLYRALFLEEGDV